MWVEAMAQYQNMMGAEATKWAKFSSLKSEINAVTDLLKNAGHNITYHEFLDRQAKVLKQFVEAIPELQRDLRDGATHAMERAVLIPRQRQRRPVRSHQFHRQT